MTRTTGKPEPPSGRSLTGTAILEAENPVDQDGLASTVMLEVPPRADAQPKSAPASRALGLRGDVPRESVKHGSDVPRPGLIVSPTGTREVALDQEGAPKVAAQRLIARGEPSPPPPRPGTRRGGVLILVVSFIAAIVAGALFTLN